MSQYVTTPDGVRHKFPDEATPDQIRMALSGSTPKSPAPRPTSDRYEADPSLQAGLEKYVRGYAPPSSQGLARTLPTAGGFLGSLFGGGEGPVSVLGAGIGGGAGEAARQLMTGQPVSPSDIGAQGAEQAGYQVVGGVLGDLGRRAARPLMRRALGVGKKILSDFPGAAETALSEAIPVSEQGAAKARGLRKESSKALYDLLNQAKSGGTRFNTADMTNHVMDLLKSNVLPNKDKARIASQLVDFLDSQGATVDPVLLKEIKRFYQARASSVYKAAKTGIPTLAQENRGLFSRALAQGAREKLETIPGVASREAQTQALMGAERAVSDAAMRPPRPFEMHKPGTYPILNNPHNVSRVALTLNSPEFQALLKHSPRAAAALVMQLTHTDIPDQTGAVR